MNRRLQQAQAKHQAFLDQLCIRPANGREPQAWAKQYAAELMEGINPMPSAPLVASKTPNRSLLANLHRESPEVRREIERKAKRIGPLFNKGGLQYPTED